VRRNAQPFEGLRDRAERHAASAGQAPRAFLCNLGEIPKHKARASYATGLLNAGGIAALDNDGFVTLDAALTAFSASGCDSVVICGSDDQYPDWVPKLAPELRLRGARQLILAGRPGDHQSAYERAGITAFIYMGVDVITTLNDLLDRMGVAS
jgi:methylmalonyl-CoA mutase